MELLAYFDLHLVYLVIFSLGLSIAAGAALLSNLLFVTSVRDGKLSEDEYRILRHSRSVVWVGIVLYVFAGVGLFTISAEAMLGLGIFYADATIAGLMVLNAFIFQYFHLPALQKRVGKNLLDGNGKQKESNLIVYLLVSESISVASWIFIILHHAMYRLPATYSMVMSAYFAMLVIIGILFYLTTMQVLTLKNVALLKKIAVAVTLISIGFIVMVVSDFKIVFNVATVTSEIRHELEDEEAEEADHARSLNTTFTLNEVALHNNIEDCWVAIEGVVYDATPAAEKYPEVYTCGKDTTENYRKIRDEGVSERVKSYEIGLLGFTLEDVASHDTDDSCWFVIDNLVFDATDEATLHPAMFHCGTDVSDNYHRNHGKGISDKMMKSHIGSVDDGILESPSGNPDQKVVTLTPTRELYTEEGSWNNEDLLVVVEKDAEKLLFIDGTTHTEVGRIHDIGFQPHTSVYSEDASYMFIIARDGWLTKIDLDTLQPVKSISVGESSRGTALTDDGKYLAIGNYIPGNVVMVDPENLEILKTIPTVGEIDGEEIESRVGAMIEDGDKVIVALKDLNSVWVIDTSKPDFPVIEKHWNIGENKTPLHDAFLTPDGKYYIVASMGSNTVWVMDTDTWKEVAEVVTGETPHTGPGAFWGNKVYVPALGEGLITSIDVETWEPVSYIKTAGPGLFIRSFGENPEYPYVWAETAFGEFHDEIYVIDARTDEIVETIRPVEGESSWHPEFTNDGKFVYVVSQSANEVEVYDAWTFELVKRFEANTPSAVSNIGNRIEERGL
jgi:YVTN family beta-propeller protein